MNEIELSSDKMGNYKDVMSIRHFDEDCCPHIIDYEAYLYIITITFGPKTKQLYKDRGLDLEKRIYIGAKTGSIYTPYHTSSEDEEFQRDYWNPENKVWLSIRQKGTKIDMFYNENVKLESVNAKNNILYYNKTNGGSKFMTYSVGVETFVYEFLENTRSGKFDIYKVMMDIKELVTLKRTQPRKETVDDSDYTDEISKWIDDTYKGNTDYLVEDRPIVVLDGGEEIKKLLLDGSQRIGGTNKSKKGDKINVLLIPRKIWKPLLMGGPDVITQPMMDLSNLFNPNEPAPLRMTMGERAAWIYERSKSREDIDSETTRKLLSNSNITKPDISKIINKAQKLWDNQEAADNVGEGMRYWEIKSPEAKQIKELKLADLRKKFPEAVIAYSASSTFGSGTIEGVISEKLDPNQKSKWPMKIKYGSDDQFPSSEKKTNPTSLIFLIMHGSEADKKEWFGGKESHLRNICEPYADMWGYVLEEFQYESLIAPTVIGKAG